MISSPCTIVFNALQLKSKNLQPDGQHKTAVNSLLYGSNEVRDGALNVRLNPSSHILGGKVPASWD